MKQVSCERGFGYITDPESGEEYNVQRENSVEVSNEVANRLKANYSGIVIEEVGSSDANGGGNSDTSEEPDPICGAEMTDGSTCKRPATECPYH